MKSKPYCQCPCSSINLGSLNIMPKDKFNELVVKVHYRDHATGQLCCRPVYDVWAEFIFPCSECQVPFSSPWEKTCKPCHDELSTDIYKGWRLARNLSIDNYNFYLTQIRDHAILVRAANELSRSAVSNLTTPRLSIG